MNKLLRLPAIIILLFIGGNRLSGGTDNEYPNSVRTDSTYVYKWDLTTSDWVLNQVQVYQYTEGKLTEILTKDFNIGQEQALSVYTYNDFGGMESATNYSFKDSWILSTRSLNEYDYLGRISSVRVQKWVGGVWIEDRLQQNYEYNPDDKLIGYESIYWRSNAWTLPTVSVLYYNTLGQLESRIATRPDGNIDYRIIYEYDEKGMQTQFYTQYPAGNDWSNWNLRTFQYNGCGQKHSQIQYTGEGPNWIPSTKTVFFSSLNIQLCRKKKVPVCHNGHTIWISVFALPAHLRHGDCLGECKVERERLPVKDQKPPFTIYPNPAKERITIRFDQDYDCRMKRVEMMDYAGNVIIAYPVRDNADLVIERGRLKAGNYYIRLTGDEVYSQVVVIE